MSEGLLTSLIGAAVAAVYAVARAYVKAKNGDKGKGIKSTEFWLVVVTQIQVVLQLMVK